MIGKLGISMMIGVIVVLTAGCGTAATSDAQALSEQSTRLVPSTENEQPKKDEIIEKSGAVATEDGRSGFVALNTFREIAGMHPFSENSLLTKAADNHARYLIFHDLYTHKEVSGNAYFTGTYPSSRMAAVGYPHKEIAENIYAGDVSPQRSVEILFSNIYHRLAFLDFGFDEIGIAMEESDRYRYKRVYTYEMGMAKNQSANTLQNPKIILWPARDQEGVMPVFYEEEPDPLPECSVSGYPISLQFNPLKNGTIELLSFRLFDSEGHEVTDTHLMDRFNDPSGHLKEGTFVLFPIERLGWAERYRVEVDYREEGGETKRLSWEFSTKRLPGRVFRVENAEMHFVVKSGESCFFDLPPKDCNDKFGTYTYRYTAGLKVEERIWDNNTIQFRATGEGEVEISPDNGRRFYISVVR
ncbi:MAG: hypothetical protein B6D59_04265 [Campylobacteraceae bacterium 4484_4]|nr:MAG: hypothetical protein B6D59_04265 [Campylobacteraceae bacterium 4484_4]